MKAQQTYLAHRHGNSQADEQTAQKRSETVSMARPQVSNVNRPGE
jgi:hypothetical protein